MKIEIEARAIRETRYCVEEECGVAEEEGRCSLVFETFLKLGKLQLCKSNFNRNGVLLLLINNFEANQIVLYLQGAYMMHLVTICHVSHVM